MPHEGTITKSATLSNSCPTQCNTAPTLRHMGKAYCTKYGILKMRVFIGLKEIILLQIHNCHNNIKNADAEHSNVSY